MTGENLNYKPGLQTENRIKPDFHKANFFVENSLCLRDYSAD
jgi:hypothetical protein